MPKIRGVNNADLKMMNRGLVYRYLATNAAETRMDLTARTGLTKMTVSNIISEFVDCNLVVETQSPYALRPSRNNPICLRISPDAPKVIGLLIHRTRIAAALCDFNLQILALEEEPLTDACNEAAMMKTAFRLTDRLMSRGNVLGIGIGSIGPVDIRNGLILNPPNFFGIRDIPIVQRFRDAYHIPVYLDHHFNCAALAEKYFGAGRNYHNYFLIGLSEGLTMGIVVNDELYSSYTGFAGEFGHLCVNVEGGSCACGNHGCIGDYFGNSMENGSLEQKQLEILTDVCTGLCNLLNPQAIIIGESENAVSDEQLRIMEEKINRMIITGGYRRVDVRRSGRTEDLQTASCAINIISRVFAGEILFN